MLAITDLSLSYGQKKLFSDVNLNLNSNCRYGIVGANGSGKSTFLRLISKEEPANSGSIEIPNNAKLGFLKQDQFKYEDEIILNVVIRGNDELWQAIQAKEAILTSNEDFSDAMGIELANLEHTIADNDGYSAEAKAHRLLIGLGVPIDKHYECMSTLSGGYKLRILLAQVLFANPDVLLLDEPTNHLDIAAMTWLEKFLQVEFKGVLLLISHDHDFLNNISTHILDIDFGTISIYTGNYDKFVIKKEISENQKTSQIKNAEEKISHMEDFVSKFKAKASKAKQAQSRVKLIEKIKEGLPDLQSSSRKAPNFRFEAKIPSGKTVLQVNKISKKFDEQTILNNTIEWHLDKNNPGNFEVILNKDFF